jgi:TP901 family phage tail tape measure protein
MAGNIPAIVTFTAVDRISKAIDRVRSKFPELDRGIRRTNTAFQLLQQSTEKLRGSLSRIGGKLKSAGQTMSFAITAPVVAATAFSIRAFADYETALIGVGKTSNLQGQELETLGAKFLNLSKEIPVSAVELLTLGQTAAQLGVSGSDNILKFSETLAKLSRASDVAGDEGAANLARFITVTGGSVSEVDRFASALVELGNTSAATESEILEFGLRLGASTAIFNVSGTQALGFATALKSVGIQSEAGSSSVQRALGNINNVISAGGSKMQVLSKVTGIAMSDLKTRFKTDAAGVLRDFAAGLARIDENGGDATKALNFFGLSGVRDVQTMGALAKNVGLLDEKLRTSKKGFEENTALQKEFAAASQSLDSQIQLLRNEIFLSAVELGKSLKPALITIFGAIKTGLEFLRNNPTLTKFILGFVALLAVLGPIIWALGVFMTALPALISIFNALVAVFAAFKFIGLVVAFLFGMISLPIWGIIAAVVAVMAVIWVFRDTIMSALGSAFDWIGNKISALIEMITNFGGKLKDFFGFGGGGGNLAATIKTEGQAIQPSGQALGALQTNAEANSEFMTQTNNARVDINVRAPQSTTVTAEGKGGFMSVNRGLVGAF